jgi:hypothetical protein
MRKDLERPDGLSELGNAAYDTINEIARCDAEDRHIRRMESGGYDY